MLHTDSRLFRHAFATEAMREVFDERSYVERFMEVEAALARAEADLGVVPETAAEEITRTASPEHLDLEEVGRRTEEIDLFTVAIVGAWKDAIGEAGEYIHWGTTSQDVADTALVLQMREGLESIHEELEAVRDHLRTLAADHAETPMMGRTRHVQALPITFGLKAATWLEEVDRDLERLARVADGVLVAELFGAVGSLAALGDDGLDVQERFAEELDLAVPDTAWHASRDRIHDLLTAFATVGGTLSRIAEEVLLLNRDEIAELEEPLPDELVGSSTMPHKRNPVKSERVTTLAALLRGHAATMGSLMEASNERDGGTWYGEYALVPEAFLYLHCALRSTAETLERLVVDPEAMRSNMDVHGGLVASEAVMMALAETAGRQTAHEIVHEAAAEALDTDRSFRACLRADERVTEALSDEEIEELTDPAEYVGLSDVIARRAVERSQR